MEEFNCFPPVVNWLQIVYFNGSIFFYKLSSTSSTYGSLKASVQCLDLRIAPLHEIVPGSRKRALPSTFMCCLSPSFSLWESKQGVLGMARRKKRGRGDLLSYSAFRRSISGPVYLPPRFFYARKNKCEMPRYLQANMEKGSDPSPDVSQRANSTWCFSTSWLAKDLSKLVGE